MTRSILCAVRGAAETRVVRALGSSDGHFTVTRRCADLAELLASAAAGLGHVVVVSADLPDLDREAVDHLHGSGVWVVAVTAESAGISAAQVLALGVDAVLDGADAEHEVTQAVAEVLDAADRGRRPGAGPDAVPRASAAGAPHAGISAGSGPDGAAAAPDTRGTRGRLVAVWGPTGAPGRTTVALNLAAELADSTAMLVDADTYGGTVAQMLGLLDEAPGIAAAARLAATGRLDPPGLAGLTPVLEGGLRILSGVSRADRWPEVSVSSLELIWSAAREVAAWTVVDCGFCVEQDEELSYDTRAPRRNGATLSALAEADVVVVVGGGDPIGLQRLVRALGDLTDLDVPTAARRVVVNRVRASASGPRPGDAIADALQRYAGVTTVHLVPDDPAGCDGAVLAGRTLREHVPSSPARRAVLDLARALLPAGALIGAH